MKIEISLETYRKLLKSEAKLTMLIDAGVDNWMHYSDALYGELLDKDLDQLEEEIDETIDNLKELSK